MHSITDIGEAFQGKKIKAHNPALRDSLDSALASLFQEKGTIAALGGLH